MRGSITNIFVLSVTVFFVSCSMGSKLDQNLAEMRAMNKNMEAMNQNMANGISEFSEVGKSVKTLSDEAVVFLKKTDPQQYFDMFNQISDKFETMLAGLMDQTGDIKTFVEQANEATGLFLKYSKALTPEDLVGVKDSLDKISGMTTQINDLMAKSGNYEAMANQVFLTTQMFAAVGLSLGQSLDVMDQSDTESMMGMLDANIKNMDLLSSTGQMAQQMQNLSKEMLKKNQSNDLTKLIDGLLETVIPSIKKLSKVWTDETMSINEKWDLMDKDYRKTFCLALAYADGLTQTSPNLGYPMTNERKKIDKMKNDLHDQFLQRCKDHININTSIK
jgi:hypothetical protein